MDQNERVYSQGFILVNRRVRFDMFCKFRIEYLEGSIELLGWESIDAESLSLMICG